MWRLSKLDIRGFKSFADPAELVFPEGITAVVGPNGCGKSNISDAIVWALGEQSTSLLRAQRMKDVIFQGSAGRKATGTAEVTLHLTTRRKPEADLFSSNGGLEADGSGEYGGNGNGEHGGQGTGAVPRDAPDASDVDGELAITRRLFRSGDSEYLLNGKKCLLRDVRERLLGTGLGSRACFTIGQGRIDQILSASPFERRAPIEEAAGISLYRRRRHGTNLKLEATAQDLARVDDICQEVARQMRSLKRQAGRARRYRALRERLRELERRWFYLRLQSADNEARTASAAMQATTLGEQVARDELEVATRAWERARKAWREQRQEREQIRQKLYHAQVEHERARSEAARQRDRAAFVVERQEELQRKREAQQTGLDEAASIVDARRRSSGEADQAARSAERLLQEARERLDPITHLDATAAADSTMELSTLAACIEVEEDFRGAVALALGDRLRLPMLSSEQIEPWLQAAEARRGVSAGLREPTSSPGEAAPETGAESLRARATGLNGCAQSVLDDLLSNVWLVATPDDALRLATAHRGHGFVDAGGQVWARGAEIRHRNESIDRIAESAQASVRVELPTADAKDTGPGGETEALHLEVERAQSSLGAARAQAAAAARELQVAEAGERRQDADVARLKTDADGLTASEATAEAQAVAADTRADESRRLCGDLEEQLQEDDSGDLAEEFELAALESAVAAQRSAVDRAQSRRTGSEVQAAEVRVRRSHLHERIRERLDIDPAQLLQSMTAEPADIEPSGSSDEVQSETDLEKEVQQARGAIDRLGPVNLVAYEDYESQKDRFEELDGQRADLQTATTNLHEAIKKIDADCVGRFTEAFESIDGYFNRIFRQLFGGGRAGMRLESIDDPLNSGIEIVAQPPGKTLQSIRLMSGGERSMIALALMFAIFEYHPSPFCILDEADAALDESNVARFIRALNHFQDRAQFIMITHNKLSMEVADLLYGVTMEDSGVSKLVSVRLN